MTKITPNDLGPVFPNDMRQEVRLDTLPALNTHKQNGATTPLGSPLDTPTKQGAHLTPPFLSPPGSSIGGSETPRSMTPDSLPKLQPYDDLPFSPPASIAQHVQSVQPIQTNIRPDAPSRSRKAKPQKIVRVENKENDDDVNSSDRKGKNQNKGQWSHGLPTMHQPSQQPGAGPPQVQVAPIPGVPQTPGHSQGAPGQPPQGFICINVPIYIGGQDQGPPGAGPGQGPPPLIPPGSEGKQTPQAIVPPQGFQPMNPTVMMQIPNPNFPRHDDSNIEARPMWHYPVMPGGMIPIKPEPSSPGPADQSTTGRDMDDLEPGEIRAASQKLSPGANNIGGSFGGQAVMTPQGPMFVPAGFPEMPFVGMRLPVAAAPPGGIVDLTSDKDQGLDLSTKPEPDKTPMSGSGSARSSPNLPSGASTPKFSRKPKGKSGLDKIMAKLWQKKGSSNENSNGQDSEAVISATPSADQSDSDTNNHYPSDTNNQYTSDTNIHHQRAMENNSSSRSRRKRAPINRPQVFKEHNHKAVAPNIPPDPASLQFTFINDSESGKMNLVGVSNPDQAHNKDWRFAGSSSTVDYSSFSVQKFHTCKYCRQLFDRLVTKDKTIYM